MYISMRFLPLILVALCGCHGPLPPASETKLSTGNTSQYLLDVIVLSIGNSKPQDAYVLDLAGGAVHQIYQRRWFHCGPVSLIASEHDHSNLYRGRIDKDFRFEGRPEDAKMDYEGKFTYQIKTYGLPATLTMQFVFKDLISGRPVFEIEGTAIFNKPNDLVVMRSLEGDHILLVRLTDKG